MVQYNSKMATCSDVRLPQATGGEMNMSNAMAPTMSPERRHSAVELREFQNPMTGISLGDLTAQGVCRRPSCTSRSEEPDASRRAGLSLGQLQETLHFVLELVSEDELASLGW
jgi:hypothetical protein